MKFIALYHRAMMLAALLVTTGCATTTDAIDCANRGLGSIGCQGDVASETDRLRQQAASLENEGASLNADLAERRRVEDELKREVESLNKQLTSETRELASLAAELTNVRRMNRISETRYAQLQSALIAVQTDVKTATLKVQRAGTSLTGSEIKEMRQFLSTEVALVKSNVREVTLG